jgi:hypothetical protein
VSWTLPASVQIRPERHFGDRELRCFAKRPTSVYEAFARACAAALTPKRWCARASV